ncbi:PfkB family carbohydrate kinase [Geobacter argillaceus]|uniref:PfkB family carbohydrate kinase n=1 Tax=Geobacter argillaceus TaxID=345631 RepID=A0A562WRM6_9BACT|nr:PfkB family carbohydrate kinase [Geobacter argillaceus]TWJ32796.1 pfkB family carbohydrate kinase [Geobacter argillaceus]
MTVTGVGQCCWDYLATVESYPSADSKTEVYEWTEQGGGPVATALVALARLGGRTRFAGVVGDDPLGMQIRASLAAPHRRSFAAGRTPRRFSGRERGVRVMLDAGGTAGDFLPAGSAGVSCRPRLCLTRFAPLERSVLPCTRKNSILHPWTGYVKTITGYSTWTAP